MSEQSAADRLFSSRPAASRPRALITPATIAVLLITLKALFNPSPFGYTKYDDGAYYYQVAKHVAAGDGLRTSVSLYHAGFKVLPHSVTFYPLWPFVLGMTGRAIGLVRAAQLVPELLFFVALGLLYILANRVASTLGPDGPIVLANPVTVAAGDIAVLVFGLNHVFFRFTSLPFTEALAFVLAFGTVLAVSHVGRTRDATKMALVVGILGGLGYLARAQSLAIAVAAPVSLAIASLSGRRMYLRAAVIALLASSVVALSWAAYVFATAVHPTLLMLIDPTGGHETSELVPFKWTVVTFSWAEYLRDRIIGVKAAFDPTDRSYFRSFGPVVYLVPLALGAVLASPARLKAALRRAIEPASLPVVATLLAGAASLAPIHLVHAAKFGGWTFQFRQGLPFIFLLLPAVPYLMSRTALTRAAVFLCVAGSLAWSVPRLRLVLDDRYAGSSTAEEAFGGWIDQQRSTPVFLTTRPSILAASTHGLFHGLYCEDPIAQVKTYVDVLKVNYLLTFPSDAACPFIRNLNGSFVELRSFGEADDKITLWRSATGSD